MAKLALEQVVESDYLPFGDGHAAEKIVAALDGMAENR